MSEIAKKSDVAQQTLEKLRKSIRCKGDLPGLASAVRLIELAENAEDAIADNMTQAVLADPTLVQKVLRLANSSMYAAFGGYVNTVSRAVTLLGTDTVAHLAVSQKLIDNMASVSNTSDDTRETMEAAVLAGHMARNIAEGAKAKGAEAVSICALLHSMGKLLLAFYLPQEYQELKVRLGRTELSENLEAVEFLGLSLEELGLETAREWGLPPSILSGLRFMAPDASGTHASQQDWLASVSTLAHRCAEALSNRENGVDAQPLVASLIQSYSGMLGIPADKLLSAIREGESQAIAERFAANGEVQPTGPTLIRGIPSNLRALIKESVADIYGQLPDISAGKALSLATEALFTGLGLHRAFTFIRKDTQYSARMSLGPGAAELMGSLKFEESERIDALSMAMAGNHIEYLDDVADPGQRHKVPLWWKAQLNQAKSFVILPVVVNRKPLGFIYGEWLKGYPDTVLEPSDKAALEELREALVSSVTKQLPKSAGVSKPRPMLQPIVPLATMRMA